MSIDLLSLYSEIKQLMEKVDFSMLWRGFKPLRFALYNETQCCFDGEYIEKTDEFLANTAIEYEGEHIAIWDVMEPQDAKVLASKMIHEMFHAYQHICGETRFPDEAQALLSYRYSAENLSIKAEEDALIAALTHDFDEEGFERLLRLRRFRHDRFPYEYAYEAAIEQIEGSDRFVELNALKQLSDEKYDKSLSASRKEVGDPLSLLPVRVVSYEIGALMLMLLKEHTNLDFETPSDVPFAIEMLSCVQNGETVPVNDRIEGLIRAYHDKTDAIVQRAKEAGRIEAEGDFDLPMVNIYDARCHGGFIVSRFFALYYDAGAPVVLNGDFVIELNGGDRAVRIYRLPEPLE